MKNTIPVFGIPFANLTLEEAVDHCEALVSERTPRHLLTANVDFLDCCERDPEQRRLILGGDGVFCDGMPLVWASRLFGSRPLPERVAGSDLVPRLLERCAARGLSVYFFGSDPETLDTVQTRLASQFPSLKVAGTASPPVGQMEDWDNEAFVKSIREARPDVLLVALGFPKQDAWIRRFRDRLGVPLSIGIGASLDFIAGKQRRSPRWMQRTGLEWLWRLATDPRRLAGRYWRDFGALGRATARQAAWEIVRRLPVLFPRRESRTALLNGLRLNGARTVTFGCDGRISETGREDAGAFVCDLSGIETAGPEVTDSLVNLAARALREGKPLAFFSPSARLRFWLRGSGLGELFPVVESPLALKALFGEQRRALPVPHSCVSRQMATVEAAALEVAGAAAFPGSSPIRLDMGGVPRLCRRRFDWLKQMDQTFSRRGIALKVEHASPPVADQLILFGGRQFIE